MWAGAEALAQAAEGALTLWHVTARGFTSEAEAQRFFERAMTEARHMGMFHLKADIGREVPTELKPIGPPRVRRGAGYTKGGKP